MKKIAKVSTESLQDLKKYIGNDENPKFFFTMTEINKIGINPQSVYATPLGVYCYPMTAEYYVKLVNNSLPFAGEKPYVNVFSLSAPTFNMMNYSEGDLSRDVARLADIYDGWSMAASPAPKPKGEVIDLEDIPWTQVYNNPLEFVLGQNLSNATLTKILNKSGDDWDQDKVSPDVYYVLYEALMYKLGHREFFDTYNSLEEANKYTTPAELKVIEYLLKNKGSAKPAAKTMAEDPYGFILNPDLSIYNASELINNAQDGLDSGKFDKNIYRKIRAAYRFKIGESSVLSNYTNLESAKADVDNGDISYSDYELVEYLLANNLTKKLTPPVAPVAPKKINLKNFYDEKSMAQFIKNPSTSMQDAKDVMLEAAKEKEKFKGTISKEDFVVIWNAWKEKSEPKEEAPAKESWTDMDVQNVVDEIGSKTTSFFQATTMIDLADEALQAKTLTSYQHAKIESAYQKKKEYLDKNDASSADDMDHNRAESKTFSLEFLKQRDSAFKNAKFQTPICKMWNFSRILSKTGKGWNYLLRKLGYTNFYDPDTGLIHPAETTQVVILDPSILINVETYHNPHGQWDYATVSKQDRNVLEQRSRQKSQLAEKLQVTRDPKLLDSIAKNTPYNFAVIIAICDNSSAAASTLEYIYYTYVGNGKVSDSSSIAESIGRNPNTPNELRVKMFRTGVYNRIAYFSSEDLSDLYEEVKTGKVGVKLRRLVSYSASNASSVLIDRMALDALKNGEENTLESLVGARPLSLKVMNRIADYAIIQDVKYLMGALATSSRTPSAILEKLLDAGAEDEYILRNPNISGKMIDRMADKLDLDDWLMGFVMKNPKLMPKTARKIVKKFIGRNNKDGDFQSLIPIISNTNMDSETLSLILDIKNIPSGLVQLMIQKPGTSSVVLEKALNKFPEDRAILSLYSSNPKANGKTLDRLLQNPETKSLVRAIALNPATSPETLDRIAREDVEGIRSRNVAKNSSTSSETLEYLADTYSDQQDLLYSIIANKNVSTTTLENLTNNPFNGIAEAALDKLEEGSPKQKAAQPSSTERIVRLAKRFESFCFGL